MTLAGEPLTARGGAADMTPLFVERYAELVHLADLLLGDRHAAEDAVQEAWVRLHAGWRRPDDPDKALAYLRSTVLNLARSRLRRVVVARRHRPEPPPDVESAESSVLRGERQRLVQDALATLPRRQREAVVLRYWSDLDEGGIAAAMGVGRGSVKTHLARGRAALAEALTAAGLHDDLLDSPRASAPRGTAPGSRGGGTR